MNQEGLYEHIHDLVRLVPPGKVVTYGQVARFMGRCTPRMAGYAMAAVPTGSDVPWHRVINSQGRVSPRARGDNHCRQRQLLEGEGIVFDERGRIDLDVFGWAELDNCLLDE